MRALRRQPPPATLQSTHLPAPTGGLNTLAAGTAMPEGDCIQLWNMVSGEHGLRTRNGYRQLGDTNANQRTLLPFIGSKADGSNNRLFTVGASSISSLTLDSGSSTLKLTFATSSTSSGRGVAHAFTTAAGNFLLYCDEVNGLHVYTESTDSWAKVAMGGGATEISGVDPATFCFVTVWKSRVWFVEKNTNNAWYLAAGSIFGAATKLALAVSAQFRHGGDLVGLWSWTLDGGLGIDDNLVAATRGGDVAIYQGTDPASASTFALKGTWNAGTLVAGRRVATNFGGDLLFLTKSGLRPLSQLVNGGDGGGTYVTAKVANLFNKLAQERGDLPGWDICISPGDGALVVAVPKVDADSSGNYLTEQLVMSLWNRSWSRWDLPLQSMCIYQSALFFADRPAAAADAYVWILDDVVDAHRTDLNTFTAIQWGVLFPFQADGHNKQVQFVRATVLSNATTDTLAAEARYNYDLTPIADQTEGAASGNTWNVATWDAGTFQDDYLHAQPLRGTTGVGQSVAIAVKGTARSRTVLVGVDVYFKEGGYL
jgi:hypothetical protein